MKKELFWVILLVSFLLIPGVIAPAIEVTITGSGSNTEGEISSVEPTHPGFNPEINCNIDNNGNIIGKIENCKRTNHCSSDSILWAMLTLKATSQQSNIEITWSAEPTGDYGEETVKLFKNCKKDSHECTIELRCPQFNKGKNVYTPDKGLSYIINAEFKKINNPPTVEITKPADKSTFTARTNIDIEATASDSDGIQKVEFYNGASKLGEDASFPYSFTWNNVAAGTYSLTAKAFDNSGASTISNSVEITVTAICGDKFVNGQEECDGTASPLCPLPETCNSPGTKDSQGGSIQCKCTQSYCTGNCEYTIKKYENCKSDGTQIIVLTNNVQCDKDLHPQCILEKTIIVPCDRRIVSLPFFSSVQFISAATLTIAIYLILIFRKKVI